MHVSGKLPLGFYNSNVHHIIDQADLTRIPRSLAITPSQSRNMDFAHVTTVCYDYTMHALKSMASLANKPFRFIYVSGILIERDQTKELPYLAEYRHMRVCFFFSLFDFCFYVILFAH